MSNVLLATENKVKSIELYIKDKLKNTSASELDITEILIIEALQHPAKKLKASVLAREVGKEPTSFTPFLDRLENKGYIMRYPHMHDRRAIEIGLMDKAYDVIDCIHSVLAEADRKFNK